MGEMLKMGSQEPGSRWADFLCHLAQSQYLSGSLSTSERSEPAGL